MSDDAPLCDGAVDTIQAWCVKGFKQDLAQRHFALMGYVKYTWAQASWRKSPRSEDRNVAAYSLCVGDLEKAVKRLKDTGGPFRAWDLMQRSVCRCNCM